MQTGVVTTPLLRWMIIAAVGLGSGGPVAAQKEPGKETGTRVQAPPQPIPVNARVLRGGKIDIPLRIFGRVNHALQYRIRTVPAFGRLTEPKMVDREVGMVTYEETSDGTARQDSFTFAVQTNIGVSAAVEVKITIVDTPSVLVVPELMDFGKVSAGSAALRELTIENRGQGVAEGALVIEEPWALEGEGDYRLEPGQRKTFVVLFVPLAERRFTGRIRYSSEGTRMTIMEGHGFAPFTARPSELELKPERGASIRRGQIELTNRTDQEQTIGVDLGGRLRASERVSLAPGATTKIELATGEDDLQPLDEQVQFTAGSYGATVRVRGSSVPALLRLKPDGLTLTSSGSESLEIENIGGAQTLVSTSIAAPFRLDGEASFTLAPGQKQTVKVLLDPVNPGRYRTWLRVEAYEGRFEVPVQAEIEKPSSETGAAKPAPAAGEPAPRAPEAEEASAPISAVPAVSAITLVNASAKRATFEWWAPSSQPLRYQVSQRVTTSDRDGVMAIQWVPLRSVKIDLSKRRVRAVVNDLRPNTIYTIRVVSLNSGSEPSAPSQPFQFFTADGRWFRITPLRILLVILAGLVALIVRRKRAETEE